MDKIRHETPTPNNIELELHQDHYLRTVSSKLPGSLRFLHCAQTFALDVGVILCAINN